VIGNLTAARARSTRCSTRVMSLLQTLPGAHSFRNLLTDEATLGTICDRAGAFACRRTRSNGTHWT